MVKSSGDLIFMFECMNMRDIIGTAVVSVLVCLTTLKQLRNEGEGPENLLDAEYWGAEINADSSGFRAAALPMMEGREGDSLGMATRQLPGDVTLESSVDSDDSVVMYVAYPAHQAPGAASAGVFPPNYDGGIVTRLIVMVDDGEESNDDDVLDIDEEQSERKLVMKDTGRDKLIPDKSKGLCWGCSKLP
ncbi:hypothetical protein K470DRAFT_270094 [Piedraia hortae CBS 480.64]|uniref:Uncharacterized protein n=1 Tax=Piedraia hortae CBS 480.64 TaxID=1314780 RepID=A0A6A7C1Y8_9PEZI|nr:hypothetical protein K470DRAFT_270094 [Piedraia hortae CBS 480.64]